MDRKGAEVPHLILAMHYVYVLFSSKDKKLYTGSTNNLAERVKRHNRGLVAATKYRRPLKLIYYEACLDIKDSMRREIYLKTSWGKHFLKSRLTNFFNENKERSRLSSPSGT